MINSFHFFGVLSTLFFFLSLIGLRAQILLILSRKARVQSGEESRGYATSILSLNAFSASFLGYYAFFIYGLALDPWNHYLVWPRLAALMLTIWVLAEIAIDRAELRSKLCVLLALLLLGFGFVAMALELNIEGQKRIFSQWLTVIITIILAQGYVHQLRVMYRQQMVGAISKTLHQLTLLKDIFIVCFGLSMGLDDGWPLVLLSGVSGLTKIALLMLYYRLQYPERVADLHERTE